MKEFAERLREIQSQRGITRKEMAAQIGIMPASLSSYMNDVKTPTFDMVAKIARALGVSVGWLCGEIQESSKMKTYEDFLRNLVALVDTSGVRFLITSGDVPSTDDRINAFCEYSEDEHGNRVFEEPIYNEMPVVALEMCDSSITTFVKDWQRIRDLYKSGTIDEEMYTAWLEKRFSKDYSNVPLPGRNPEK